MVTSLVAVRRRFPYEFWYAVHLLTYAAVLTSLPHQFSVGGLFAEGTWQRWYWLAICIATGAALLYYRVLQPLVATFRHQLTVSGSTRVAPGVVNIEMTGLQLDGWPAAAAGSLSGGSWPPGCGGIRTRSACPPSPCCSMPRARARCGSPSATSARGSAQLARLKPGTKVAVEGPYGLFSTAARSRNHVVMIGAGIGITPFRALLESTPFAARATPRSFSAATANPELYLGEEILELCRQRGATLFHLTGPRTRPASRPGCRRTPPVPATGWPATTRRSPTPTSTSAAPPPGRSNVLDDARAAGVREEQLHYERFDW